LQTTCSQLNSRADINVDQATFIPNVNNSVTTQRWWLTAVLTTVATMAVIDRTILSLLFDPIRNDLGFSDTQMSLIFGLAFAVANVCFTLPAGYLVDRISRRGLITFGALTWSVMTSMCGLAGSFSQLLLARAGVGSAESIIHPGSYSLLRSTLPAAQRSRGFAIYSMSIMGGSALGFLLGGVLISAFAQINVANIPLLSGMAPWRLVMLSLGFIGIPVTMLMLTIREPAREPVVEGRPATVAAAYRHFVAKWPLYVPLIVFSASLAMQSNAYGAFIASVPLRRWQIPVDVVGTRFGLIMLVAAPLGNLLVGSQMDKLGAKFGVRGLAMVGTAMAAFMCVVTSWAPVAPTPTAFFMVIGFAFMFGGAGFAVTGSIIAALTPTNIVGKISAVQLFIYGVVGMGSGPAVVGYVSDRYFAGEAAGIAPALSRCCLVFTAVSVMAMLTLVMTSKRRA
jgi:MFS family permease